MAYLDDQTIYKRMKIVVSIVSSKKGDKHLVQVMDENVVVYSKTASSIEQRDKLVWHLAETYNALDIEVSHKKEASIEEFRFSEIPSIPILDEQDAEQFFDDNEEMIYNRILQTIEEGVFMNLKELRLFELNGTGVYLTSQREHWKSGLERAIEYFVSTEEYEKCIVAKKLLDKV